MLKRVVLQILDFCLGQHLRDIYLVSDVNWEYAERKHIIFYFFIN